MKKLTLEEATALALEGKLNNSKLDPQKIVNFVNDSIEFLLENNEGCCEYELDNDLSIFCGWSDGYDKNDESGIKPSNEEESTWRINVGIKCNHDYLKTDFDWLNFPYDKDTGDVVDTGLTVQEGGISVEDAKWLIDEYRGIREALDKGDLLLETKKVESLTKKSSIQGLEHYSEDEIKQMAEDYIKEAMLYADYTQKELDDFKIIDMNIYGSRNRGTARDDSDLDIVFEYTGDFREDDLFNLLNDEEEPLMFEDIVVDFNPICAEKSGDMDSFMARSKQYDDEILNKKKTESVKSDEDLIKELQDEIARIDDKIESIKHLQLSYRGERENYIYELQDDIEDLEKEKQDCLNEIERMSIKEESKKVEGVQSDRQANSIKWLKDSGYEEYKTGDNYTALINKTKYDGQVVGAMFYGKSYKPAWHYRFKDIDELDKYIDEYLKKKAGQEEVKQQWKDKRKLTKDHDIKVGDIFYTSWGYDQTNIDFYEVVAVRGSRIDMKELHQQYVGHDTGADKVIPATGENRFKDDKIYTVSARADGTVTSLSSFEYPSKWDGRPKDQTDAYSGH